MKEWPAGAGPSFSSLKLPLPKAEFTKKYVVIDPVEESKKREEQGLVLEALDAIQKPMLYEVKLNKECRSEPTRKFYLVNKSEKDFSADHVQVAGRPFTHDLELLGGHLVPTADEGLGISQAQSHVILDHEANLDRVGGLPQGAPATQFHVSHGLFHTASLNHAALDHEQDDVVYEQAEHLSSGQLSQLSGHPPLCLPCCSSGL